MSLASVHIVSSDIPLIVSAPLPILADCGKSIDRPALAFIWDSAAMNCSVEWAQNVCAKCRKVSDSKNARYIYGVCRGIPAVEVQP